MKNFVRWGNQVINVRRITHIIAIGEDLRITFSNGVWTELKNCSFSEFLQKCDNPDVRLKSSL